MKHKKLKEHFDLELMINNYARYEIVRQQTPTGNQIINICLLLRIGFRTFDLHY